MPNHTIPKNDAFTIEQARQVNVTLSHLPVNGSANVKVSFNTANHTPQVFRLDRSISHKLVAIPAGANQVTIRNSGPSEINIGW